MNLDCKKTECTKLNSILRRNFFEKKNISENLRHCKHLIHVNIDSVDPEYNEPSLQRNSHITAI